jgi:CRISPR-associated protein Csb2
MSLVLEIEYLAQVAFAAQDPSDAHPDWPPQPDRVFSALAATWGARGERPEERHALEWLESQRTPDIAASDGRARSAPTVFVPPNDAESQRVADAAVLPQLRRRQPRRFPAFRPDEPVISLIWRDAAPDAETLAALNAVALDTAYVGHSASLTRCRFRDSAAPGEGAAARRQVYPGRLAELERDYHAEPRRRPAPGALLGAPPASAGQVAGSVFADRWLVLEHAPEASPGRGGAMPDIRAAALVAKELRNSLMSGYREIGLGEAIPVEVSGHLADGKPSPQPHLAIVPMAFLGAPHASGTVFGFALVPPRRGGLLADPAFQRAARRIIRPGEDGRRLIVLDRFRLAFSVGGGTERRSLEPARYVEPARVWASGTPIVLDRHLKETANAAREAEIERLVARACANTGLPEPRRVVAGKHSAIEGAPSAYPSDGAPPWMRWRLPESLASRQLTHAVLEFTEHVSGPVILGAGRFVGLGLCLPLDPRGSR